MATTMMATTFSQFTGLRSQFKGSPVQGLVAAQPMTRRRGKGALGVRCDFIGSSTNV
ncbi:photosystem I reaction center subunit psaK chloroplastic-like, partial [Trifolium medium]|nr:photosystem I reaction center subunit psaK chloroplastic-like [Trifolium medium]